MKKKTISLLALSLAATVTLTACTGARIAKRNEDDKETTIESSYVEENVPELIIEDRVFNKVTSQVPAFITLLDEFYKSNKDVDEILNTENQNSVIFSSALYMKLREFGLSDEVILKELHNVVTFGLVHPEADGWKNDILVENLNKSVEYKSDAIVYYYPLAAYVHLYDCKLEHETIENRIKCEDIYSNLMEMNEGILFENYVVENVLALDDQDPLKIALNRILNSGVDKAACIRELENIFKLAIIPRCATEEEWDSVIHLRSTIGEMENPFEVYYDLAVFAHTLRCEEEHYKNEFGQWECESLRKEMESGLSLGK